jgi:predicted esterase
MSVESNDRGTGATGDPHAGQRVLRAGPDPSRARLVAILLHGRGAGPEDILSLGMALRLSDVAFVAPAAAGHTWYPYSFLSPMPQNEPGLSSGLKTIATLVDGFIAAGVAADRIALMGFSQGACLSLEFAARHARRYAAVIGLSGGLIGPPGTPRTYTGSMGETPVFLGCSDVDAHIPLARVNETAEAFRHLGAVVDERIYAGMGHTVSDDEIAAARALLG